MRHKILIFGCCVIGCIPWYVFAFECEYSWKFEQCIEANKQGTAYAISEFECPETFNTERVMYQIILDEKFKEIDEEIEEYLGSLTEDAESSVDDPLQVIDDITQNFAKEGYYWNKYEALCQWEILAERAKCSETIPNIGAAKWLKWWYNTTQCLDLVDFKLDVYRNVAKNQLKLNKSIVLEDKKQEYVQQQRTKYDELLSIMLLIVGHVERLLNGLTHYTKNPL